MVCFVVGRHYDLSYLIIINIEFLEIISLVRFKLYNN